jgi:acid phosphatase type 7
VLVVVTGFALLTGCDDAPALPPPYIDLAPPSVQLEPLETTLLAADLPRLETGHPAYAVTWSATAGSLDGSQDTSGASIWYTAPDAEGVHTVTASIQSDPPLSDFTEVTVEAKEPPPPPGPIRVIAVGDIACDPESPHFNDGLGTAENCRQSATSDVALALEPDAVLALGDLQYGDASLSDFQASYGPSWGRLNDVVYPALGNHEYDTPDAAGYFAYLADALEPFGAAANDPARGYYSFDLDGWHVVVLNSNCAEVDGGCGDGSPQHAWLVADLAENSAECTIAVWHHPRYSSGNHGNHLVTDDLFDAIVAAGVEILLTGHDHHYERFAPLNETGAVDEAEGVRVFVVGTGGKELYVLKTIQPNSLVRDNDTYGVLVLDLFDGNYSWEFVPEPGKSFSDSGGGACH